MSHKTLPTDREILNEIYDRYYDTFAAFDTSVPAAQRPRQSKVYVAVDCAAVAQRLGVDPDIVFGRLYYHLDRKHGYRDGDGALVALFTRDLTESGDHVNFPLLASVLADLRQEHRRIELSNAIAGGAVFIAIVSLVVSAFT